MSLGSRLDLDELAITGHDDIRINIRLAVLQVVKVQQEGIGKDTHTDSGDLGLQRVLWHQAGFYMFFDSNRQGEITAGDGGGARAAIGL